MADRLPGLGTRADTPGAAPCGYSNRIAVIPKEAILATDIDIDIDRETAEVSAREPRVPNAVWINRPAHAERGSVRPVGAVVAALAIAALLAVSTLVTRTEPIVPAATAGTTAEPTGNGPTGYFPDAFDRTRGEIEPLPPTF